MSVFSPVPLLALVLLAGSSTPVQPGLPDCEGLQTRIELTTELKEAVREVCISPELSTTFRFDSPLAPGVELQSRERFEDVAMGTSSFTVHPPSDLQPGERFEVVVHFADGSTPTIATFSLVAHPVLGARQVDVFRHKRTVEDYQRESQEERKKSQHFGQELERMRLESGPGGLTGLIISGTLAEGGVAFWDLMQQFIPTASNALEAVLVNSYRSNTRRREDGQKAVRVAVEVRLMNPRTQPWAVKGAALVGTGQRTHPVSGVWQSSPIPPGPGTSGVVVVELELTAQEARGPFALKLWDESGKRLVTLGNVTFP